MNILIAKTILQSWINENEIALYENDAEANFWHLFETALELKNQETSEEILQCLKIIDNLDMKHILKN